METGMPKMDETEVPMSDRFFFAECLNEELSAMRQIRAQFLAGDEAGARHAFAEEMRQWVRQNTDRFFAIPYEEPENAVKAPEESEQMFADRILAHQIMSCGTLHDFGRDNPIDWMCNPTYNQYKEWTWQLNRHHEWKVLAHRYRETGDLRYAACAAGLFRSWVKQAAYPGPCSGYQTTCWRTIECGIRMNCTWPYVFMALANTEPFTDEVIVTWCKSVWQHGDRLSRDYTSHNWLIMEMNGLAYIGLMFPQLKQADRWYRQALRQLTDSLAQQIYPDGFQYELTTNYHMVVLINYLRLWEILAAFGKTMPEEMFRRLDLACSLLVKIMMPDGRTPDLNDGNKLNVAALCRRLRRMLPDSHSIRWLLDGASEYAPDYTDIALNWSGMAVMRSGWGPDAVWALMDAGPFGAAHQHEDKLNLLFYAGGRLLLTEGGNYAYDTSEMRKYVLSTRSHNTVRVDGADQNRLCHYQWHPEEIRKPAGLVSQIGSDASFFRGTYDEGYGDEAAIRVRHERSVYFLSRRGTETVCDSRGAFCEKKRSPYLVVVDRMTPEDGQPHSYEAMWHLDDSVVREEAHAVVLKDVRLVFSAGEVRTVCGQETPEWQGFCAEKSLQGKYQAIPCVINTHRSGTARFVTVIDPEKKAPDQVAAVDAGGADSRSVRILFRDGTERTLTEE